MTDVSHLDTLLAEETIALRKALIEEFTKSVRDPDVASTSYATRLKAIMEVQLQATDNALG
jgi:hypothetical protein